MTTYEIIRTDRENGDKVQVAHDLESKEKAEKLRDVLRAGAWSQTIARGTIARYGYHVKEQIA